MATIDLTEFQKLNKDIREASRTLGRREGRYLVDLYYQLQDYRISTSGQVRSMAEEPHETLQFFEGQTGALENQIKSILNSWTDTVEVAVWAKSIIGIGPVISAGLYAHIDIEKAETVGHIWRFAGLDPTIVWNKGERRPFNGDLKVLCWKLGESFVKFQNNDKDYYGKLYRQRKEFEIKRNDEGYNEPAAAAILEKKRIGKDTDAYKAYSQGKIPPAQIHARARRWAVKLFLAHYHEVAYRLHNKKMPPNPYVMDHLGHVDILRPPNFP